MTYRENNHQFKIGNIYSGMNYDILDNLSNSIVNDLPSSDISTSTIYLKPIGGSSPNTYEEYIYINSKWEIIGTTKTDLSDYYTKIQVDNLLNSKVDKVNGKGLSTNDYTTAEKTKLSNIDTITTSDIDAIITEIFRS